MKFRYKEKRYSKVISFGAIIGDVAAEMGLSEDFLLEHIRSFWKEAVGDILATHSYPYKIVNRIVYVMVDHPIYANEITLSQSLFLKKLLDLCGSIPVDTFKCTIKNKSQRKKGDVYTHR